MPPGYVKPYVKRNKNDAADAEAICEAVTRPNMRFVPIKTQDQQSILMLHRTGMLAFGLILEASSSTKPPALSLSSSICGPGPSSSAVRGS